MSMVLYVLLWEHGSSSSIRACAHGEKNIQTLCLFCLGITEMVELMNSKQLVRFWWSNSPLRRSLRRQVLTAHGSDESGVLRSAERLAAWAPARSPGMPKWDQYNGEQTGALCGLENETYTHARAHTHGSALQGPSAPGQCRAWTCVSTKPHKREGTAYRIRRRYNLTKHYDNEVCCW